jgi:cell wall-associated NlpC family hydrolase
MLSILRSFTFLMLCSGLLIACSHTLKHSETTSKTKVAVAKSNQKSINTGDEIADLAKSLLGSPYKYGGASPKGFDCSGLVYYTHGKLGIRTPRTSLQQHKSAKNISLSKLHSGDLVFFTLNKASVSHVGIYLGNGRFIHAPKSGKRVTVSNLSDDFWRPRIVSGGRLY